MMLAMSDAFGVGGLVHGIVAFAFGFRATTTLTRRTGDQRLELREARELLG